MLVKKIVLAIVCPLSICGGLLGLHLVAQSVNSENTSAEPRLLIEKKLEELSERELLERKVEVRKEMCVIVQTRADLGMRQGRASFLADAYANHAAAEIELYRHTGEKYELLVAHQSKIKCLTDKFKAVTHAYEKDTAYQKK